ncbi:unnamed protein product [Calypogeia fissa]
MEVGAMNFFAFLLITILIKEIRGANASKLDVSPRSISKSGDTVTVSWAGVTAPTELDFLAIYTPPDSDHENFIGWIELSSSPGWESGSGSVDIPLVNMRTPYQFRLFRGKPINVSESTPVDEDGDPLPTTNGFLTSTVAIQFTNYNEPTQTHLALTSDPNEMRVMFVTRDGIQSFVKYGHDNSSLNYMSTASAETYHRTHMCDSPANSPRGWRDPGIIHDAVMQKLAPGKRYFYQVGSDEGGWSEIYSFVLPDAYADETDALLFGDMGTTAPYKTFLWLQEESERTLRWLQRDIQELGDKAVFISHIGDISYARGYEWLWDEFFHRIQPVASQAAYHVCIGNHEYDWPLQPWKPDFANYGTDGGGECGVPYSLKFHMPGNSSLTTGSSAPATRNLYYSLSVGVVHFLYFSTETNFLSGSEQHTFMEEDLQKVDRQKTPFVIVLGHRPMYTTDLDTGSTYLFKDKMIENLEPLFIKYNVNLVLWGHVHKYERTCAIDNFTCPASNSSTTSPQAPIHVVIGMAGQDWQPSWQPRANHPEDPIFPQPMWSLYRSSELGYVRLHATRSLLTLTYIGNHDGQLHDVLEIHSNEEEAACGSCHESSSSWQWFLCFALAALGGAVVAAALAMWLVRSLPGLQRVVPLKTSYVPLRSEDSFL